MLIKDKPAPINEKIEWIFKLLYEKLGPQGWWPAETPFEVCIGAILTQNTNWNNVEKAIKNIKKNLSFDPITLNSIPTNQLAELIKPAGYYNIKAKRLKSFLEFLCNEYNGDLNKMFETETYILREKLLSLNGIGPETADSILLYGGGHLIFVVDAYTYRILLRHNLILEDATYDDIQMLFMENLPNDVRIYNEYHALLVKVGKNYCKKTHPKCDLCPLKGV